MAIDDVEATFRARMRVLGHKGGAVTKRRYGTNPRYYRDIGRLGGQASVAARRAKIAAKLDAVKLGEAPIVEAPALAEAAPVRPRAQVTLKDVLADIEREGRCLPDSIDPRQSLADFQAEKDFARWVERIRNEESEHDDEPCDPWG